MSVREIEGFLEQWQMNAKDLRRRMILAPTPRERWYASCYRLKGSRENASASSAPEQAGP